MLQLEGGEVDEGREPGRGTHAHRVVTGEASRLSGNAVLSGSDLRAARMPRLSQLLHTNRERPGKGEVSIRCKC